MAIKLIIYQKLFIILVFINNHKNLKLEKIHKNIKYIDFLDSVQSITGFHIKKVNPNTNDKIRE